MSVLIIVVFLILSFLIFLIGFSGIFWIAGVLFILAVIASFMKKEDDTKEKKNTSVDKMESWTFFDKGYNHSKYNNK